MNKEKTCGYYSLLDKNRNPVGKSIFDDSFAEGFPSLIRLYDAPCIEMPPEKRGMLVNEEQKEKILHTQGNIVPAESKVSDYVKAEYSLVTKGPVSLTVLEDRKQKCLSCEHLIKRPEIDEIGFCGACGCGERKRAVLSVKIQMPDYECPVKKWGKSEGIGVEHLSRIGGRSKQIAQITQNVADEGKSVFKKSVNYIKNIFKIK